MTDNIQPFPIQGGHRDIDGNDMQYPYNQPSTIPWWLAEIAYAEYSRRYGTTQSLETLADRGGFGRWELLGLLSPAADKVYKRLFS